jgi:2-(1,2-epoxy-1,2-dihydrophenyl)acetyl-CoA isomerase
MSQFQFIDVKISGGVFTIKLNRPEVLNSFHIKMGHEVQQALDYCQKSEIRCIVITGNGKAFSAGQDLDEALNTPGLTIEQIVETTYNPIISKIIALEKPVIAAVNGVAAGAGANIALACDLCVASKSASFIQAFSKIGLIPDSGGTYFLPKLVGKQKAAGLMFTGEKISSENALAMNMIYKVYEDDQFENEVNKLANQIANMPTQALVFTKRLLQLSEKQSIKEQLNSEKEYQKLSGESADYKEGVAAFLEKRKPNFKGN